MTALPPYSVLMPLAPWEAPAIVFEALMSLHAQTLPPAQVVVSCDGSLPEELQVVVLGTPLVVECVRGPGGEGVGPVLARGLLACAHELVVRADADDLSLPHRCALQIQRFSVDQELVVLGSWINEFVDTPSLPVAQRRVPIQPTLIHRLSRLRNPFNHPSVAFRRSAVLAVGNYRQRPGFEDYDLWLRILSVYGAHACANCAEALVHARVGVSHLGRRHGLAYALAEARFFLACAREQLLPWSAVVRNLLVRFPLRVLPPCLLQSAMGLVRKPRFKAR